MFDSWPSVMVKLSLVKALMKLYGRCSEWPRALEVRTQKDVTQRIMKKSRPEKTRIIFDQLGSVWINLDLDVQGLFLHVARWSSSRYLCRGASQHSSSWQIYTDQTIHALLSWVPWWPPLSGTLYWACWRLTDLVHGMLKSLTPGNSSSNIALVFRDFVELEINESTNQFTSIQVFSRKAEKWWTNRFDRTRVNHKV